MSPGTILYTFLTPLYHILKRLGRISMTLKYVCQEAQSCIRLENREEQERKSEHFL